MHFDWNHGGTTSKSIFLKKRKTCLAHANLFSWLLLAHLILLSDSLRCLHAFEALAVRIIKTSYPIFLLLGWWIANKGSRGLIPQAHQPLSLPQFDLHGCPANVFSTLVLEEQVIIRYARKSLADVCTCAVDTWEEVLRTSGDHGQLRGQKECWKVWKGESAGTGKRVSESSCSLSNGHSHPPTSSQRKELVPLFNRRGCVQRGIPSCELSKDGQLLMPVLELISFLLSY